MRTEYCAKNSHLTVCAKANGDRKSNYLKLLSLLKSGRLGTLEARL